MHTYVGKAICNGCSRTEPDMIEIYYASGNAHSCKECWPSRCDYYDDDAGRHAWQRVGNYYAPTG